MRHHQPDPADDAGDRHHARGHQRGGRTRPRRRPDEAAQAADVDAERTRLVVAEREHADAPAVEHERHEAHRDQRGRDREIGHLHAREAAEQPERDGGELVVRIGHDLDQRDAGARERTRHDAAEHQHQRVRSCPRSAAAIR
jgi:hypothetical protein